MAQANIRWALFAAVGHMPTFLCVRTDALHAIVLRRRSKFFFSRCRHYVFHQNLRARCSDFSLPKSNGRRPAARQLLGNQKDWRPVKPPINFFAAFKLCRCQANKNDAGVNLLDQDWRDQNQRRKAFTRWRHLYDGQYRFRKTFAC